ncbi:hypothetical protein C8R43DRAFT_9980 [Mycena crocata]|nr:hypothetical protein C8R43DRAFT_9980 [Mycena crocata]
MAHNSVETNMLHSGATRSSPHPGWLVPEANLPPSFSRRVPTNPNPEPNPFATGSLVEALAEPSSASRNSPARSIRPRKGDHKRQSSSGSRHPSSPTRRDDAARAATVAAMQQALSVQHGPSRPALPPVPPRASARQPLGWMGQPRNMGQPAALHALQAPAIPQGRAVHRERRPAAMYTAPDVQHSRIVYQTGPSPPNVRYPCPDRTSRGHAHRL